MANQPPPSRPWLILGSMRPVATPPAPAEASQAQPQAQPQPPAPRPIFRPTFGQAFRPTTQPQQPPPQPPTAATAAPPFRVGNVSSVPSNPSQKTTPPSEKIKPTSPPPLALTLPPAYVKSTPEPIEQKTMTIEKPNPPFKPSNGGLQKDVGDTVKPSSVLDYEKIEKTKDMESKDHEGNHKKAHSKDNSMKITTIAGDNKGAIMELNPASKKHDPQGNSNTMATPSPLLNIFMNSNVQAVNNSILVNASCTNHEPGVHVFFSRGGGRGLHLKDYGDGQK
ncbi:mucin-2-like [Vitis riparia]|uniref:mucin-2-like n=1 Tax=Vitis riparia TaxID=96939 RepID=UPI00155B3B12|nr:mucin-2-like [Vitis riparia]